MVHNPDESWWVVENALRVMSMLPKEKVAGHLDRLLYFLGHEEWWLQHASLIALAPLAVDDAYYRKIMPKIREMIVQNTHAPATQPLRELTRRLKTASPKVREAGRKMFAVSWHASAVLAVVARTSCSSTAA